jgi:hypothetical protein
MIALAAILVGCSSQPPHLAASKSCTDKRVACLHSTAPHYAHYIAKKAKPARITAKTEATTRIPPPSPTSRTQIEPKSSAAVTDLESTMGLGPDVKSGTVQEQVAAATGVAEQMTAAALAPAREPIQGEWPNKSDRLVAIVMSRPEIKSVTDLAGKSIAIDERYSASSVDIWTAFVVAGVSSVQLSAGKTTAIDRLSNGEATAAVLALVSADAAEAFPEIAGFKIFRVPLRPLALKARP